MHMLQGYCAVLMLVGCLGIGVTGAEDVSAGAAALSDLCIDVGTGVLQFRYMDRLSMTASGFSPGDLAVGDLVYVPPDQPTLYEFLERELGTDDDGAAYYGRTGLSFDPDDPKLLGHVFVIGEIEPSLRFTEPFPEEIRNRSNSYIPFDICVIPGPGKVGVLGFRYSEQLSLTEGAFDREDFSVGDLVYVLPNQPALSEFLERELGTDEDGAAYYGRTGLSFDPDDSRLLGHLFVIGETESNLRFTEPFPERIRNSGNSYIPFEVVLIPNPGG